MGTKNNPGKFDCYDKAEPDEPMFILLARDSDAATLVRIWCTLKRKDGIGFAKLDEALHCADAMEAWKPDDE